MNKIARASSVAVMLLLVSVFCGAATCTGGGSLSGDYGMLVSGTGKYLAGALYFDGNCNLSGSNITGGSSGQYVTTSVTGTYGQNSDGTLTLTMNLAGQSAAQTYVVGVSESGIKARGMESDGTVEATIDLQSQLTTLVSGYNAASLNGTYAASCFGSAADLNYVTFDGKGNLTGVDPFDNGGTVGNNPYAGTYSVNSDGTFSGALVGNYSAYTFNGVIDNGVSEIEYIYDASGSGGVLSCVGKQSTTANLLGYYGIVVSGTAQTGGGGKYLSGSVYFNGAGGLSATNLNGGINATYGNTTATGTYTVNSDNTISITMNLAGQSIAQTYIVGVSEAGNEAVGIETDGTAVATIDMQSQLQLPSTPYSAASLNGTYSASCGGSEVDLNYVTFDGLGNLSGIDAYDNGSYGNSPYTGTYTVNSDGTFSGGFAGSYSVFTMTGVIDNGNAEMEFTYNESGVGGIVSCVGESTYGPVGTNPVAATPTFTPAPGAYGATQSVTLSDTPGAVIFYTTNGATPTTSSSKYSTPIAVSATTTIQAIAVASGYNNSAIAAGTYFITTGVPTAATPTFSPAPGTYPSAQAVTLSDTTTGAVIYYTTNGTTPSTTSLVYSSPITVSATTTIEAIAVASGYNNSAVASGNYTITIGGGGTVVNLASYYNVYGIATVGSDPKSGGFDNDSYAYNSSLIGTSLSYQSIAFPLAPANALDAVDAQTVSVPVGSFRQLYLLGAAVNGAQTNQSVVVTYTDGSTSTFTQSFSDWAHPQTYTGETNVIQTASRIAPNGATQTGTFYVYGYTFNLTSGKVATSVKLPSNRNVVFLGMGLNGTITPTTATPTFSPAPGSYTSVQSVTVSDSTSGAVIYYTTNGTTPNTSSSKYSAPITVSATTTIEAIAVAIGYNNSTVATGVYTLTGTPIVPYIQVNSGTWQQTATATVAPGSAVNLGPQPLSGSWSWTGPNGYTSTSRQINSIPLSTGTNIYVATYTNSSGVQSTQTFTITVTAKWTEIGTNIDSIACASDGSLVVASNGRQNVYEYLSGTWTQLPGQMLHVAIVNKSYVWGIGQDNNVYRLSGNNWIRVGNNAAYISAGSDGTVLVTNSFNGSIWKYVSDNNWVSIPGSATVIAVVSNNNYFAVSSGNVWHYNGSGWTQVGSNTAYVRAASDGTVLATNSAGQIWQYVSPNNWVQVPGTMTIAAPVKVNSYFGMGTDSNVYSYGSH